MLGHKTGNKAWNELPGKVGSIDVDDVRNRLIRYKLAIPELEAKLNRAVEIHKLLTEMKFKPAKRQGSLETR